MIRRELLSPNSKKSEEYDLESVTLSKSEIMSNIKDAEEKEEKNNQLNIKLQAYCLQIETLEKELKGITEENKGLKQKIKKLKVEKVDYQKSTERLHRHINLRSINEDIKNNSKDKPQFFGNYDFKNTIGMLSIILFNLNSVTRLGRNPSQDENQFLEMVAKLFFLAKIYKDKSITELEEIGRQERWQSLEKKI